MHLFFPLADRDTDVYLQLSAKIPAMVSLIVVFKVMPRFIKFKFRLRQPVQKNLIPCVLRDLNIRTGDGRRWKNGL